MTFSSFLRGESSEPRGTRQSEANPRWSSGEPCRESEAPLGRSRRRREELRREAKRNGHRFATISYRWDGKKKLPHLRLSGQWLHDASFSLGQELEVTVRDRQLVIDAVCTATHPGRRPHGPGWCPNSVLAPGDGRTGGGRP